jgi:hypothetical protein
MKRSCALLSLLACTLAAACSGGDADKEVTRGPAAEVPSGGEAGSQPQSVSYARGTVPVKISGKLGRFDFEESGTGECGTSAEASIYEVPATQWHVTLGQENGSNIQYLNLTVWRPRAGGDDMVNLALRSGEATHQISTVKGGTVTGSGTAGMRPAGKGGVLTVSGKDDHGHPLELTVQCERFDEIVAEGG